MNGIAPLHKSKTFHRELKRLFTHAANRSVAMRLLKTGFQTKFFTNGSVITAMLDDEHQDLARLHWDLLVTNTEYAECSPFNIGEVLPQKIKRRCLRVLPAGRAQKRRIALIMGDRNRAVYALENEVSFLGERHPDCRWYFSGAKEYWTEPIVLLRTDGFLRGTVVAAISPVPAKIGRKDIAPPPEEPCVIQTLGKRGSGWRYS